MAEGNESPEDGKGDKSYRASQSFTDDEVQILHFILSTLLRGGSCGMATRHKAYSSLMRKVISMHQKVQAKQVSRKTESSG